jgi:hypothetical protein
MVIIFVFILGLEGVVAGIKEGRGMGLIVNYEPRV